MTLKGHSLHAFVTSRICRLLQWSVDWRSPNVVTDKLQHVMNSAACAITNTRKFDYGLSHVRHDILHWLDVPERVTFKLCLSVYKCLRHISRRCACRSRRCLAVVICVLLSVDNSTCFSRYRRTTAGRRAFSFAVPSAWNSLPTYMNGHTLNLDSFKRFLKSFLIHMY